MALQAGQCGPSWRRTEPRLTRSTNNGSPGLQRELLSAQADDDDGSSDAGAGGSEEQVEIPWLHNDPLSELQVADSPFYPIAPTSVEDGDDVSDAVLDEAWRRAGLSRIKSVSQVRVRTTPGRSTAAGESGGAYSRWRKRRRRRGPGAVGEL